MLDALLKILAGIFRIMNKGEFKIAVFFFGAAASLYSMFWVYENRPLYESAFLALVTMVIPYLLYKAVLMVLLALFDLLLTSFGGTPKKYDLSIEKLRARISRIFYERKLSYQSLDGLALGIERQIILMMRNMLSLNYPLIYVCTDEVFIVVKVQRVVRAEKVARIGTEIMNRDTVMVNVFSENDPKAKALSKLIESTLDILQSENELGNPFVPIRIGNDKKITLNIEDDKR